MKTIKPVLPPAAIGIIGAGQLGKMLSEVAKRMGYRVIVLDPKPDAPAGQISDEQIVAEFSNFGALERLAMKTSVLTYEFEHIDAEALSKIEALGYKVYPSAKTLRQIQNKYFQKMALKEAGVQVPPFEAVTSLEQLHAFFQKHGNRMVIKACKGGYDGKGNWFVHSLEEIDELYSAINHLPLYVEAFYDYTCEISVIYARNAKETVVFPVSENKHEEGILVESWVPALVSDAVLEKAKEVARQVAAAIDDYGVFCIELFVGKEGDVVVNEIAPRPHNTGHFGIEACNVSQYDLLLRVITGMPLMAPKLLSPCAVFNILGTEGVSGAYHITGLEEALTVPDASIHLYGKPDTQPRKKMGHVTVVADSVEVAKANAKKVIEAIVFNPA